MRLGVDMLLDNEWDWILTDFESKKFQELRDIIHFESMSGFIDLIVKDVKESCESFQYHQENLINIKNVVPALYDLCVEVQNTLNLNLHVNYFIESSADINAYVIRSRVDGVDQSIIVMTSALVNLCSKDELKFVIGHEFGHIIMNRDFEKTFIYQICADSKTSLGSRPIMRQEWLCSIIEEVICDRFGLLACKDISACLSFLSKLQSGIDSNKWQIDIEKYHETALERYEIEDAYMKLPSHPNYYARVVASKIFHSYSEDLHERKEDKTSFKNNYDLQTRYIYKMLDKMKEDEHKEDILNFYTSVGLLMSSADGTIRDEECEEIIDFLSNDCLNSRDEFMKRKKSFLSQNLFELAKCHCEIVFEIDREYYRSYAIRLMLFVAIADSTIAHEESKMLLKFANEVLGYSEIEVSKMVVQFFREERSFRKLAKKAA
jgi:uncharacterized tellurite resistance protein B-like protein